MDVTTHQYINSPKVTVSFEVSSDDWCLIQQSESWKRIQNFLEVSESKGSRMCLSKVDELIDTLAEHIRENVKSGTYVENELAEQTKALAELVSARGKTL